jgi:hypothetical protein
MITIRNATPSFLRVKLPGGKLLRLGPGKTGQIADGAQETEGVRSLVEAGQIEIVGEGAGPKGGTATAPAPHARTGGRNLPPGTSTQGDR